MREHLKRVGGTDERAGVTVLDTHAPSGAQHPTPTSTGPVATTGPARLDGPACPGSTTGAPDLARLEEHDLRALRADLAEEALRLGRWQRLVRARMDLATDRLSPAEPVGGLSGQHGPAGPGGPADLVALVRGAVADRSDVDPVDDLRTVALTHRALRGRATALAGRLAEVDRALAAGSGRRDPVPAPPRAR